MTSDPGWLVVRFGPALVGGLALFFGIRLLIRRDEAGKPAKGQLLGAICLLVALGIGACYGILQLHPIWG